MAPMNAHDTDTTSCALHIAALLQSIEHKDGIVHAYCEVLADEARAEAAARDRMPPGQRGPLWGVGIGIKEVFDVAGALCAWGSDVHAGRRPTEDAAIVRALRNAGGIILGTTTSTEYAMARRADTTNPFDPARTPGASSSGSAAAVAAGLADVTIGSQTIGSGIRPAAYCGVFGYKPTQGALSLEGAMPLAGILDHPVIFSGEIASVVTTFNVLLDSEAAHSAASPPGSNGWQIGSKAKIALVYPWFSDAFNPHVWDMVSSFARQIPDVDCTLVTLPERIGNREEACLATILSADMWRHHEADYHRHSDKMSRALRTWLERGREITAQEYLDAIDLRAQLTADLWDALRDFDFVVTLSTTDTAPLLSEGTGSRAPQRLWNLVGCPAISGPIGLLGGLPVGLQIVGRTSSDAALLDFASHAFGGIKAAKPEPVR